MYAPILTKEQDHVELSKVFGERNKYMSLFVQKSSSIGKESTYIVRLLK